MARLTISPSEMAEKLEWLVSQYEAHLRLHRFKLQTTNTEIVVTSAATIVEELLNFRFGSAAKVLFGLRCSKVDLLKAEIDAPGSEVAYVVRSRGEVEN